jgi:hypothetical protein
MAFGVWKEPRRKKCGHSDRLPSGAVYFVLAALHCSHNAIGEAAYSPASAVNFTLRDTKLVGAGRRHDIRGPVTDTHHGGSEGTPYLNCFIRVRREKPSVIHSFNGNNEAGIVGIGIIEK